jgi:hypothetical protein
MMLYLSSPAGLLQHNSMMKDRAIFFTCFPDMPPVKKPEKATFERINQ